VMSARYQSLPPRRAHRRLLGDTNAALVASVVTSVRATTRSDRRPVLFVLKISELARAQTASYLDFFYWYRANFATLQGTTSSTSDRHPRQPFTNTKHSSSRPGATQLVPVFNFVADPMEGLRRNNPDALRAAVLLENGLGARVRWCVPGKN